jgi:quinol monooxygenase YgiN
MASLLVVSRFRVDPQGRAAFQHAAGEALEALTAQPGCRAASLGQSTDDPHLLVIRSEWDGVGAYRRALSAFDVKVRAVPLLSSAIDEPSAYELVRSWTPDGLVSAASGLAADAGVIGLGESAGPDIASVTS